MLSETRPEPSEPSRTWTVPSTRPHDPASCVLDAALAQANGTLGKVFGWYDNEWGCTNRFPDPTELVSDGRRTRGRPLR